MCSLCPEWFWSGNNLFAGFCRVHGEKHPVAHQTTFRMRLAGHTSPNRSLISFIWKCIADLLWWLNYRHICLFLSPQTVIDYFVKLFILEAALVIWHCCSPGHWNVFTLTLFQSEILFWRKKYHSTHSNNIYFLPIFFAPLLFSPFSFCCAPLITWETLFSYQDAG